MSERKAPASLSEAFAQLRSVLPPEVIIELRQASRASLFIFHLDLVAYVRRIWVHGRGSPLADRLMSLGVLINNSSIAEIICEAFWLHLKGVRLDESRLKELLDASGLYWTQNQPTTQALQELLGVSPARLLPDS